MYLVSLTPQRELALFASLRAHSLDAAGRLKEAVAAMRVAYRYWPRQVFAVWATHFSTKALFPGRTFPDQPCEETAGANAIKRLLAARDDRRFETQVITTG
jgi:hypothetical protein